MHLHRLSLVASLRFGRRLPDAPRSIVGAIRAKWPDCSGDSRANVARCGVVDCDLHPFRFGKNPNRSRRRERPTRSKPSR